VLVYAGDGPLRGELEARAAALAPGAVKVLGFVRSRSCPPATISATVRAASGQEAWGRVVNEVMCAGAP
jgi:hypothetical protein